MGYYINPPADGFEAVLNYKKYIDKSGLIAYTNSVLNTPDMLTCSTRPRRFGKSFAAKMLAPYIGFTEGEVRELCTEFALDFQETQKWYDGYRFEDDQHVYCPNSIMELISRRKFDSYWTKTETYEALRDL